MNPVAANDRDDAGGEARRWIARLASGATDQDDLERLDAWLNAAPEHRIAFQRERQAWQDLSALEDAFGDRRDDAAMPTGKIRTPRRYAALAIAASVAAVYFLPALLLWARADHVNAGTWPMTVAFADGSRAMLDADTAIAVDLDGGSRDVTLLKGRAWFDVRHGDRRPFRVHAGNGTTEDVGTAFVVEQSAADVRVGVTEGRVRVFGKSGRPLLLPAGGQARYAENGDAASLPRLAPDLMAPWRKGELLLREAPVAVALAEIGRYRAGPIYLWGDMSDMPPVSGSFRTDRADDALQAVATMRGLEQMHLPGGVLILRRATK